MLIDWLCSAMTRVFDSHTLQREMYRSTWSAGIGAIDIGIGSGVASQIVSSLFEA